MDELVQFLTARLDEDEQAARAVTFPIWSAFHAGVQDSVRGTEDPELRSYRILDGCISAGAAVDHAARHDPARVLRDVEARRRLLELHEPSRNVGRDSDEDDPSTYVVCCGTCQVGVVAPGDWPCETLRLLALPYADHPGYREAWRP